MSGEAKTSGRRLSAAERQAQAVELRKAGVSYEQIARSLGYSSKSGAYKAVQTALQKTLREPAQELRTLQGERLDALLFAVWPLARKGHLGAVDRVVRIEERRARLEGLDAPERKEHTGPGGGPIQHEDVGLSDEQRATRVTALLDRARARRAGLPTEGAGGT